MLMIRTGRISIHFVMLLALGLAGATACRAASLQYQPIRGASPVPLPSLPLQQGPALEAYFDGLVQPMLHEQPVAGAVVVVVKDGQVIFAKGYGYADLEDQIPVDPATTLFGVGSISKLFTWTAVMQLVQQGKLNLDTDVNRYLKEHQLPETYSTPVTMRNLMTHTAGFEDGGVGYLYASSPKDYLPLGEFLFRHVPARVWPPTTDFNNGTGCAYSNWGASLAGLIVQTVSDTPFDDYIRENIFDPLGMANSSFSDPLPPALASHVSKNYVLEDGELTRQSDFEGIENWAPAGAMRATGLDMSRFMIALLQGGQLGETHILSQATVERMFRRHLSANPALNGMDLGFFDTWINGRHIVEHEGDARNFHAALSLLPAEHVGIFVAVNTGGSAWSTPYHIDRAFIRHFFPAELPRVRPGPDALAQIERYAGAYRIDTRSYTKIDKVGAVGADFDVQVMPDGTLMLDTFPFGKTARWVEVGQGVFRNIRDDTFVAFQKGEDGRGMYLLTSFPPFVFSRVPWYGTSSVQVALLIVSALMFLWIIATAIRHHRSDRQDAIHKRWARPVLAVSGLLLLATVVGVASVLMTYSETLDSQIPWTLYVVLALPLIAIPLIAVSALCAFQIWRKKAWSLLARMQYSLAILCAVGVLWLLDYWNLIGYRFG